LTAISFDNFADVYPRLFFWHVDDPQYSKGGSLVTNSRTGKGEFPARDANLTIPYFLSGREQIRNVNGN